MPTNLERRLQEYDQYIAATPNPAHQAMIKNFRDHNEFEQTGQVERIVALYAEDAEFHIYGGVFGKSREQHLKGHEAIRQRYERMWTDYVSKSGDPPSRLEHLMVTDWGLAGIIAGENVAQGSLLRASGYDVDDPDTQYRQEQRVAFFREYRGDVVTVMTYVTSAPTITKIMPTEKSV